MHCKRDLYDVLIDRTTIYGNPYPMRTESDRVRVVRMYEKYARARMREDAAFRDAVRTLYGKTVACWCAPRLCHGDVLLRLAVELVLIELL